MTVELLGAFSKSFLFALATLLPILNPAATAPIFLGLTQGASGATRAMLARRIARNMFWLLLGAMLVGSYVLDFFGISLPIVRVGGGLLWRHRPGGCSLRRRRRWTAAPNSPRASPPTWPAGRPSIP